MKTTIVLAIILSSFVMVSAEPLQIIPMSIYSYLGLSMLPVFYQSDCPDVDSFYECRGTGFLEIKTKLISEDGTVVEKWDYPFGTLECDSEGELWYFGDWFCNHPPGRYKVEFQYIYEGHVKKHSTKIYVIPDIPE